MSKLSRRSFVSSSALIGGSILTATSVLAQQPNPSVSQPVYRISKNEPLPRDSAPHPLDPALQIARQSLQNIRENIVDYTAVMIKRERINGTLGEHEFMLAKVRNRKMVNNQIATPFSVYLGFLKPSAVKGREVIYVENRNNGNIVAHEGGMRGRFLPTVDLHPTGMLAMSGQRYPITEMGIENLVVKLIEKGERDRHHGECNVEFGKGAMVDQRVCTVLTVTHPISRPHFDFNVARIFIDDEFQVPVRYEAYVWPSSEGGEPELLEEYTYQKLQLNVGLTELDFDRKNPKYNF